MIEIIDVSLSKQMVKTGEQVIITIDIRETVDFPYDHPYDFPIAHVGNGQ